MITLDRDAPLSVGEQLVEQLRYVIGAGKYRPGERLPSTRALGDQVGVSFHTVRKAYQRLAEEGVLDVRRGGGYYVSKTSALPTAERMERASATVQEALQKLVALGLDEEETEMVVQEQLAYFERPGARRSLVFAAPYRELAEAGAEQSGAALQERVEPVLLTNLRRHAQADAILAPLAHLQSVRRSLPEAEVVGVDVRFPYDTLERLARRAPNETVALVTRYRDGAAPLESALRTRSGFEGSIVAITTEAERRQLEQVVRQADLVLYTPGTRRRVRALAQSNDKAHAEVAPVLTTESLERVRQSVGR
ncbi:MAG TPA: GntR family transcriptional regulator [Bacteroidetes bacterium]|nr:GntR family transcriptional regulator [Bacteroidota bacterium]